MSNGTTSPPELDPEERRLVTLLREIFIAFRDRNHPPGPGKHPLIQFLESAGGTAVISVLIAGIATQIITCSVQTRLKERDTEQAYIKSRGDQALVSYKDYLDKERETVQSSYSLIGSALSASQRLIGQTGPEWTKKYPGMTVEPQRNAIRQNFNEVSSKWQSESVALGLSMSYYHPDGPDVLPSWRCVQTAVSEYLECARCWDVAHSSTGNKQAGDNTCWKTIKGMKEPSPNQNPSAEDVKEACSNYIKRTEDSLDRLTNALESSRHYPWEGWNSLEELKSGIGNMSSNANNRESPTRTPVPVACPQLNDK
jgi:hypothetical protein